MYLYYIKRLFTLNFLLNAIKFNHYKSPANRITGILLLMLSDTLKQNREIFIQFKTLFYYKHYLSIISYPNIISKKPPSILNTFRNC